jgi:hypothetical protein
MIVCKPDAADSPPLPLQLAVPRQNILAMSVPTTAWPASSGDITRFKVIGVSSFFNEKRTDTNNR